MWFVHASFTLWLGFASDSLLFACFKQVNPSAISANLLNLGPAIAECLKDGNTPVRLAAERCALHVFQLTKGNSSFPFWLVIILSFFLSEVLSLVFAPIEER